MVGFEIVGGFASQPGSDGRPGGEGGAGEYHRVRISRYPSTMEVPARFRGGLVGSDGRWRDRG